MKNKNFRIAFFITSVCIYFLAGIAVIILGAVPVERTKQFIGIVSLIFGVIDIFIYIFKDGFNIKEHAYHIIIGIISICFGFIFIFNKTLTLENICFYWGVLDIISNSIEIKDCLPEIKKSKVALLTLITSIGGVVLGVLLCVHLEEGITLHMIYLGAAIILQGIEYLVNGINTIKNKYGNPDKIGN